jgi:hypothetical protein
MPPLSLILWGSATLLTLILLACLILRRQYHNFPLFGLYLVVNLTQTVVGIILYDSHGFTSAFTYQVAWTTQAVVMVARALAATEVGYLVLGSYKGVWALAVRIVGFCGLVVFLVALSAGRISYQSSVSTLEIGLEACIGTGIAGLFLFARYYDVCIAPPIALLGLGLGLLSCFKIFNDLLYERLSRTFGNAWNYGGSAAFVGVLLIWIWGFRKPAVVKSPEPALKPASVYASLIPQVNQRLSLLNQQLTRLWRLESPKP